MLWKEEEDGEEDWEKGQEPIFVQIPNSLAKSRKQRII